MPGNLAELTNLGLWVAGSRIYASYRMAVAGQGGAIPPDVAAVVTVLKQRETSRFGEFVGSLRLLDGGINEAYARRRRRDMPAVPPGQSILDPVYYQYTLLQGAPEIEDEWVWHDMPAELYVANDPTITDEERAILQDLLPEYGIAAEGKAAGRFAYTVDPVAAALAKDIREEVLPSIEGFGVPKVVNPATIRIAMEIGRLVLWGLGVLVGGGIVIEYLKNRPAVAEAENRARELAQVSAQNQARIEMTRRLFDYCAKRLETGAAVLADCNRIREQLGALEPVARPTALPAACGFGACWPWALGFGGLGLYVGHKVARRYGVGRKKEA